MFIVPESVEVIYSHAFSAFDARIGDVGSSYLKHIIIVGNIRELHNYAFAMNSSIENVVFFTNAPWAESDAFHYANSNWNHINVYYPVSASGWDSIISICQNGVQEWIPVESGGLTGNAIILLVRNDGIAELIGSGALWDEVSIPAAIKEMILHFQVSEEIDSIGSGLFNDCPYAETITFLGTVPPECRSNAFNNMPALHTVYVPTGYISAYTDAFRAQGIALPLAEEGQTHSHTIVSGVWNVDETYHWQECTVCSAAIRKSPHSISGSAETCTACGIVPETISVVVSVTDMQITPGGDASMTLSLTNVPENGLNSLIIAAFWNTQYLTITETAAGDLPFAITNSLNSAGMGALTFESDSPITETGTLCTIFFHAADLDASEFPAAANMLNLSISSALSGTADLVSAISGFNIEVTAPADFTYEVNEDGTATITGYTGEQSGDLVIPGTIDNRTVTAIGDWAFGYKDGFTGRLEIPDSVVSIGNYAFYDCSGFEGTLDLPENLVTIGNEAFAFCSGFNSALIIPASVVTIGENAFYECTGFVRYPVFGSSVRTIGNYAFYGCSGFKGSLTIPDNVETIGEYAFCGCSGLTGSLTIGNGVKTIGKGAFQSVPFAGTLTIGENVETIDEYAFYQCSGFTGSLVIPDSVVTIGISAFDGCTGFNGTLTLGASLKTIGEYAFHQCFGFNGSLTIPDGVMTIGNGAFAACNGFTGMLTIPASVAAIGDLAFTDCYNLASAYFMGDVPQAWGNQVFFYTSEDFVICYDYTETCSWTTPTWTAPDGSVYNTIANGAPAEPSDLNGDGAINESDALYLLRHTILPNRYPLSLTTTGDADYNRNGTIDARDAAYLYHKVLTPVQYTRD